MMRFAVVVHGPEAVDTGLALELVQLLQQRGEVRAVMSGYTGVAAVIDAGLENLIDISKHRVPSSTLIDQDGWADVLLLVNSAKSPDSAMRFGGIVHQRCADNLTKPFIQVDQENIIVWSEVGEDIAIWLSSEMSRPCLRGITFRSYREDWRELGGILPGENIWVNGFVVGRATCPTVKIGRDGSGRIVAQGIELKATGVARLGPYDPFKAHVRSGVVRRTSAPLRVAKGRSSSGTFLIDHVAERAIYHCRDASLVVTVGDDTSRTAGSVLARFGVPIVAIVDGDEDGICDDQALAEGSVVLLMRSGTDDIVGAEVRRTVFHGKAWLDEVISPEEMARTIVAIAGDALIDRIDDRK